MYGVAASRTSVKSGRPEKIIIGHAGRTARLLRGARARSIARKSVQKIK
jgi:hypothetical protein